MYRKKRTQTAHVIPEFYYDPKEIRKGQKLIKLCHRICDDFDDAAQDNGIDIYAEALKLGVNLKEIDRRLGR